ncbi:hypothetical protein G5C65_16745 [Streptomyces sp. SB3404]|uniref:Uncharacterized protein n=1 Tax=Streptomyces boncukensis TaxID=2711219 RepID=A0A6G4WXG0_9ACTN|nr:hypothetical protein [Streptomyces boncukensis]
MATCKECGARKRRWPRSCSRCRSESGGAEVAGEAADLAVSVGVLGWITRGVMSVVRLVIRAFN